MILQGQSNGQMIILCLHSLLSNKRQMHRNIWQFFAILSVSHLFMACPVSAQQADIIVRGSPLPDSVAALAYDGVNLDRDRIQNSASGRIEDVLRDVAGLQQFRRTDARSANATSQGATLRGLGGNASSRALLVLDGVPQSDPFGGWITWPAYGPDRLQQIRVTRGGGSGQYGSGALSGIIEIESVGERGLNPIKAELTYGSRNSVEANALVSGNVGGGFAFLSASYARGDGFVPIIEGQRGTADIAAPYEQASFAARAVFPLGQGIEAQASALAFTDRRTRGTILSDNGGDGADASLRLVHKGRWLWQALAYLQLRKFQSRFTSVDAARATIVQTVDQYNVPSTGLGARFEIRPPLDPRFELRIGGDWRRTEGETKELFTFVAGSPTRDRDAGGRADTLGAFAELSARFGAVTLSGGGRVDHWRLTNGRLIERLLATGAFVRNEIAPERSGWEGTGRGAMAWQSGSLTLRGAAYLGWRLPTLNELYRPFRVGADATAANPLLKPERMQGAELGIAWHRTNIEFEGDFRSTRSKIDVSATAFVNHLSDAIANVSLGTGLGTFPGVGVVSAGGVYRQRLNIDAIHSEGVELDASISERDWQLAASYAFTNARVRASGLALPLNGLRPAQVPHHMVSVTLGWKTISTTLRYVSDQFEDDQNSRRLGAALTVDAVVKLPLSQHVSLALRGENLADTQVDAAISATGIIERASPRTLWIGLALR